MNHHKIVVFLLFFVIFSFYSQQSRAELVGPIVMGLQLGMPESEVISVLKNIAKEKDLKFESNDTNTEYGLLLKNGRACITVKINSQSKDLGFVEFYSIAFNAPQVTNNFIKNFLKSYKIHVDEDNIGKAVDGIRITKPTDGYMLLFSTQFSYIWLQRINKTGPVEFK